VIGYEVARRLRQDGRFENATFVALTVYGQGETTQALFPWPSEKPSSARTR
jgi:CheY-like chemotaxis protein